MSLAKEDLEEAVKSLTSLTQEIKLNTQILVTKLEQVNTNIERLEKSVEELGESLSDQDRRLTILEQQVPHTLITDLAVIKETQSTFTKFFWILAGVTATTFGNMLFRWLTGN